MQLGQVSEKARILRPPSCLSLSLGMTIGRLPPPEAPATVCPHPNGRLHLHAQPRGCKTTRTKRDKMKNLIHIQPYCSPCGDLLLGSYDGRLCLCNWTAEKHPGRVDRRLRRVFTAEYAEGGSDVTRKAARQLDEYFARRRRTFDVPLLFAGTPFQKAVWTELLKIPYGHTVSYGELARRLGLATAVRAVANASGANAISLFAPCHRVVGSDHSLTGFGGGLAAKRFLLDLEGQAGSASLPFRE